MKTNRNNPTASRLATLIISSLFLGLAGSSLAQDVQTFYDAPASPAWRDNYSGGSGAQFTVGPTNVIVSHLGFFQSNAVSYASIIANGGLNTNHLVGIYSFTVPPKLLAQVIVPSGSSADYYTNQFAWMPLDPPFLLQSNTSYYVAALPYSGDNDLWGDTFAATVNPYFVGANAADCRTVYGPGGTVWPIAGFSLQGAAGPSTYCVEGMANLAVDQARVGVQNTNVITSLGATLSVVGFASGQTPINYQWWEAPNTPVSGQTNAILTIPNAALTDSGTYFLTASNALGGEQSANVAVFVGGPVAIQQPPTNTTVFALYPVTFSCIATGGAPVYMEWSSNGIPDPTTVTNVNAYPASTFDSFFTAQANNGDVYSCLASNYVQGTPYTVTSSNATLTVLPNLAYPQEILHGPPAGVAKIAGGVSGGRIFINTLPILITHLGYNAISLTTPTLTQDHHVGIWNGTGTQLLGYVVVTNGTPTNTAIGGYVWAALNPPLLLAAGSNYILGAETFATGDPYNDTTAVPDYNKVITPGGSIDVALYLASGGWPNAPLSGGYGSQMYGGPNMASLVISNQVYALISPPSVSASAGSPVTLTGYVGGPPPVTAQWYLNGVAVPGQTNNTLNIASLANTNAGNYTLVAMNTPASLAATSQVATVIIYGGAAVLAQSPETYTNALNTNYMTLYAGASPAFSVTAVGNPPLTYQWFTNGAAVDGATNVNYTFPNVTTSGASAFYCVVSNTYLATAYTATSMVWSASILPSPTNSSGGLAPYPQSVLALNPVGYWRLNEADDNGGSTNNPNGGPNNGAIAYDYAGGNDGIYTNMVLSQFGYNPSSDPSDTSALFGWLSLSDCDANSIAGINFGSPAHTSAAFTVEAWVNGYAQASDAGIVSLGWGGGGEQFCLDCGSDTAPTSHGFRFFIRDAADATHLVASTNMPSIGTWYHLVGVVDEISSQNVKLYINGQLAGIAACPSGSGILPNVYGVIASTNLMNIGSRAGSGVGSLNLQFAGNINDVAVYNYALSADQVMNQYLQGAPILPYLNPAPPTNFFAGQGQPMSIPATAFGQPVLGYQWVNKTTSTVLASGTGAGTSLDVSYATNNTPASWNGQTLELTVTNANGAITNDVVLTVSAKPAISQDLPSPIIVGQGQTFTYNLGVVGVPPLASQWYEGASVGSASAVSGATNTAFAPSTGIGSTNVVFIIVTNSSGSVTSAISSFDVVSLPNTPLATAIAALQPVAYWPMHEAEPAVQGDVETNYGSLGALGNAYYPDWGGDAGAVSAFTRGYPSAIAGDSDPSLFFALPVSNGGSTTNAIYVPQTSRATTLNPPFTVECWVYPTVTSLQGDVWSQNGYAGLNAGSIGSGSGSVCGVRLYFAGAGFQVYSYNNSSGLNGPLSIGNITSNHWYHVVVTCDVHTNISLFTNGVQALTTTSYTGLYSPDYWTPFEVGSGRGDTRGLPLAGVDEVSVYTNALSYAQITNHYLVGLNPSPAIGYFATVTNDNPVIYLRMDAPAYTPPPVSTWATLYNYGSVIGANGALNGVYTPGTMPGLLPGPSSAYSTVNQGTNVALLSGVSSFADAGYNAAWDPSGTYGTGSNAFSVTCMFRGNPADNRVQDLVGHSDTSWLLALSGNNQNGNGSVDFGFGWTASPAGGEVQTGTSYNDGKWHQAVGVYQPGALASPGVIMLYVDGQLVAINSNVGSNGIPTAVPYFDVTLGAAPDYTNLDLPAANGTHNGSPYSLGRQLAGQVCDVAIFNKTLTPQQVQSLYLAAGGVEQALAMPYGGQLPVTWSYLGSNLGNNLGPTNLMTLYAGASPSFKVAVSNAPVDYLQWFTNGVAVGFGTNAILTLPNVQSSFTTYCIATNDNNSVTSVVWSASVVANPDAAGTYSQTIMSDNPMAYWRLNEAHGSTVALDYAGGANGLYGSQTTNGLPGVPFVSATPELSVEMNPNAANNINGTVTNAGIVLYTNACTFIVWDLPSTAEANYNGTFDNRSTANFSGVGLSSTVTWGADWNGVSQTYGFNSGLAVPAINQWFMGVVEIFPQYSVLATFTNTSAGYVFSSYVTNTTIACPVESFYGGNEIGCDPFNQTRRWNGQINELAIFNYDLSPAQLNALYIAGTNGAYAAPVIATQPQNATVAVPNPTNFTVGASSFALPLTYQWYYNTSASYAGATALVNGAQANGSSVANAATAKVAINNTTLDASGYYFIMVTNSVGGSADSGIAQLSVITPTTKTNIAFSVAGGTNLVLNWPATWIGARLQAQTNSPSVGLGTNWVTVGSSTGTNQVIIPIVPTNGSVFYRLIYP